jgi:hypothetical protein
MAPTPGRTVLYALSEQNVADINRRRNDYKSALEPAVGAQAHVGNSVRVGDIVPLIVVRVWDNDGVNGQAFLDGNDTIWVTSAPEDLEFAIGDKPVNRPGTWIWPPRV